MTQEALGKIWSFFVVALDTLSFLFFLRTTGAAPKGDLFGILAYGATTIPLLALPFDLVLFAMTLALTWLWSERSEGSSWALRLPLFYFDITDVDPATRDGRIYQGFGFLMTIVMPVVLIMLMFVRFLMATVYDDKNNGVVNEPLQHFTAPITLAGYAGQLHFGEIDGPEYFRWEAWLFSVLALAVLVLLVCTVWSVCAGSRAVRN